MSMSPASALAAQSVAKTADPLTVEMDSCSESKASLVAGDLEVAASAAPVPWVRPGPLNPWRTGMAR